MSQTSIPYEHPASANQILGWIPPLVNLIASEAFSPGTRYGGGPSPATLHLLLSVFPIARGFILAPQGVLRPVVNPSGNDDEVQTQTGPEEANIAVLSFSSSGAAPPPGREAGEQTVLLAQNSRSYYYTGRAEVREGFLDIVVTKIYPDGLATTRARYCASSQ